MELTEREWDVLRDALDRYAGDIGTPSPGYAMRSSWKSGDAASEVRGQNRSIARDLYFRFSHEPV